MVELQPGLYEPFGGGATPYPWYAGNDIRKWIWAEHITNWGWRTMPLDGTKLRRLREERQLSVKALSELSELSTSYIYRLQKYGGDVPGNTLLALANALDLDSRSALL